MLSGRADPMVEAQEGQVVNRCTGDEGAGQVDGIQGPDRLTGERSAGAVNYLRVDVEEIPVGGRRPQAGPEVRGPRLREAVGNLGADQGPVTLDKTSPLPPFGIQKALGRPGRKGLGQGRVERRIVRGAKSQRAPPGQCTKPRVYFAGASGRARRTELCHDLPPITNQESLSRANLADVLAQAVLQFAQAHGPPFHGFNVASRSYIVNPASRKPERHGSFDGGPW